MDAEAFASLYLAEFSRLVSSMRRFGASLADGEDLVQELFVRALSQRDRFDPARPARPWLMGFAFRVWSEAARDRHRQRSYPAAWEPSAWRPDELFDRTATTLELFRAMDKIHATRRDLFEGHVLDGIAIPKLAKRLRISPNTAYSRLRLAMRDFRKAVQVDSSAETPVTKKACKRP